MTDSHRCKLNMMDIQSHRTRFVSRIHEPSLYIQGPRAASLPPDAVPSGYSVLSQGPSIDTDIGVPRPGSRRAVSKPRSTSWPPTQPSAGAGVSSTGPTSPTGPAASTEPASAASCHLYAAVMSMEGQHGGSGGQNPDDWKNITDPKERRMAQNRVAQRRYREKQRKETEEREAIAANTSAAGSQYQPPSAEDLGSAQRDLSGVPWGGLNLQDVIRAGQARVQQQSQASPGIASGGRGGGSVSGGTHGSKKSQ